MPMVGHCGEQGSHLVGLPRIASDSVSPPGSRATTCMMHLRVGFAEAALAPAAIVSQAPCSDPSRPVMRRRA
jgi:hypothetical protein